MSERLYKPLNIHPGGLYIEPLSNNPSAQKFSEVFDPECSSCEDVIEECLSAYKLDRKVITEKIHKSKKEYGFKKLTAYERFYGTKAELPEELSVIENTKFFGNVWILDIKQVSLPASNKYIYVMTVFDPVRKSILNWSIANTLNHKWYETVLKEASVKSQRMGSHSQVNAIITSVGHTELESINGNVIKIANGVRQYIDQKFWNSIENKFLQYYTDDVLDVYITLSECFSSYNRDVQQEVDKSGITKWLNPEYEFVDIDDIPKSKSVLFEKFTAYKRIPLLRNWKMYSFSHSELV